MHTIQKDGFPQAIQFDCSRRKFDLREQIIGIELDGDPIIYQGSDGEFPSAIDPQLTDEEAVELADEMIARWTDFKERRLNR